MGEGQNKIARSLLDLEPTAIIDLFLLYPDINDKPELNIAFHGGFNFKKAVVWQGITYIPIGIELDSFEKNSDGSVNRPKIKFSNNEYFMTHLLRKYRDFSNAKIIRKRTFIKFLDDENFDGGNPFGVPDQTAELTNEEYVISQKTQETKDYVEFELTSPLDLDNKFITNRKIYGKYCFWDYRGQGCEYKGVPIQKDDGSRFEIENPPSYGIASDNWFKYGDLKNAYVDDQTYFPGDYVFTINNNIKIYDLNGIEKPRPLLTYYIAKKKIRGEHPSSYPQSWDRDGCNKKLSSCRLRFNDSYSFNRFEGVGQNEVRLIGIGEGTSKSFFQLTPRTVENGTTIVTDGTEENSIPELVEAINVGNWTLIINIAKIWKGNRRGTLFSCGRFEIFRTKNKLYFKINFSDDTSDTYPLLSFSSEQNYEKNVSIAITSFSGGKNYQIRTPKTNYKKEIKLGPDRYQDLETASDFKFCDSGQGRGFNCVFQSIIFLNKSTFDSFYSTFWLDDLDNPGYRPPVYDFNTVSSYEENIMGWWEADLNDKGSDLRITNKAENNISDLYYYEYGDKESVFYLEEKTIHSYNKYKKVSTKAGTNLPFGGFPGTDGFDFKEE